MNTKAAVQEDEDGPKKILRPSRGKRRPSTEAGSPPRKRSKRSSKRTSDKKSRRGEVTSSSSHRRRRRRRRSPSPSLSTSSPSSASRSCSTCSSSSSERSVSPPPPPPPRSRSRGANKRKSRGRDRDRGPKRRKARRSTSSSSASSRSGGSRSGSKGRNRRTKDGTTRDEIGKDYEKVTGFCFDRGGETLVAEKGCYETERYEKNASLEKMEIPPPRNADGTEDILPAGCGSPVAEDLELILRQKALDNFRKFRAAAAAAEAMAEETDNGAARRETLTDSPQKNAGTKVTEARSAAVTPVRRQASSLGAGNPTEPPKSEGRGNGTSPWIQKSSAGSPSRVLEDGDTGGPAQHEGSIAEAAHPHSTSQPRPPQDGRTSRSSVTQRLVNTNAPGSASGVNQRLQSGAVVSHVNGAPRIKSVVSIPAREGLDGSATPQRPCENPAPVEIGSGGQAIRDNQIDISKAEGTNGDDRKTSEPSASNGSVSSSADVKGQVTESRIGGRDGSQFQKKTFSRMRDGETVEVSYKVHIPKKTPALARRKLQR